MQACVKRMDQKGITCPCYSLTSSRYIGFFPTLNIVLLFGGHKLENVSCHSFFVCNLINIGHTFNSLYNMVDIQSN